MTADKGTYRQLPQNQPHGVEVRLDKVTNSWTVNTGQSGTVRDQRLSECVQMTRGT